MTVSYCHKPEVVLKGDGEPFVAYDAETGVVLEINETAFRILEFCDLPRRSVDVVRMLENQFEGVPSREVVESDVQSIISILCEKGFLSKSVD